MYTVTYKSVMRNEPNYGLFVVKSVSTLNEALNYIPFFKPAMAKKRHVFEVSNKDCSIDFTVILSIYELYVIFHGMGARVYDYSHADEAIEFIKTMAH